MEQPQPSVFNRLFTVGFVAAWAIVGAMTFAAAMGNQGNSQPVSTADSAYGNDTEVAPSSPNGSPGPASSAGSQHPGSEMVRQVSPGEQSTGNGAVDTSDAIEPISSGPPLTEEGSSPDTVQASEPPAPITWDDSPIVLPEL